MFDSERGYRIYMPMFFGTLLIFYLNRSFWIQPRKGKVAGLVLAFLLLVTMAKQRAAIAGAGASVLIGAVHGRRPLAPGNPRAGGGRAPRVGGLLHLRRRAAVDLGSAIARRVIDDAPRCRRYCLDHYLSGDSSRWIFGVGATTRFGDVTLGRLFGNRALLPHRYRLARRCL